VLLEEGEGPSFEPEGGTPGVGSGSFRQCDLEPRTEKPFVQVE
jgi:hypothetical protein